jgi:transposase InsO family protein
MLVQMDEMHVRTLEDIERFLSGGEGIRLRVQGCKDEVYAWIERTLVRFRYLWLSKKQKGLVRRYIQALTGYSRAQATRLIEQYRQTGHLRRRQRTVAGFEAKYTREDIRLLAEVDQAVDGMSGTAIKAFCKRAFEVYGDQRFARLTGISVSHIYNLRKSKVYQRCRRTFTKTNGVKVNIGERCKPQPDGKPGHLRVDTVHQGDMDGKKGVYHINATDEVTQWEIIVTVERISETFMLPALESLLAQFPFTVHGFHADNGSEYINHKVAGMLNDMMIRLTKSRPRHSNDNALAESKNNAVVRKIFGYIHIPQQHADLIDAFNRDHLNPCANFHRPCHFPTITTDHRGKQVKRYRPQEMMTPYEKLKSLPNAPAFLKTGVSLQQLDAIAYKQSDLDAWRQLQKARTKLFNTIFGQPSAAA